MRRCDAPCPDARHPLVTANLGLIGVAVRKALVLWPGLAAEGRDELSALCVPPLVRAARDFDPARGAFSTLAVPRMVAALQGRMRALRGGRAGARLRHLAPERSRR